MFRDLLLYSDQTTQRMCGQFLCCSKVLFTGINAIGNSSTLFVYPNPKQRCSFTIGVKDEEVSLKNIEIYNVLGEKVYSEFSTLNSPLLINLNQPAGVYFYRIVNESGGVSGEGKLIIVK